MNVRRLLRDRLHTALTAMNVSAADIASVVEMVIPAQDPKHGDYQINCAMPLAKLLGKPPRDVATELVAKLDLKDLCEDPTIAGPGFINLKLRDSWLAEQLKIAVGDERLNVAPVAEPKTYVVDFSGPNVAKPMHVGHIRSTAIGDAICRTLKFLGHKTIGDNHIGDWGTQFGMIIYGYRHFRDDAYHKQKPVHELARLYRLVNQLISYLDGKRELPKLEAKLAAAEAAVKAAKEAKPTGDKNADKRAAQALAKAEKNVEELTKELNGDPKNQSPGLKEKLAKVDDDPTLVGYLKAHPHIESAVLQETAKLHSGDAENLRLWHEFMPPCLTVLEDTYKRLNVTFDETLGESFYHERLAGVVDDLVKKGIARESDGALCVFFPDQDVPMLIRKKDGAFLYSTTDLATISYRMERWKPDAMLYVVDHRQGLHFEHLFAAAKLWGFDKCDFRHVAFGTVMGSDGKPYKTKSGDTVGLESLLDEAVERAYAIVCEKDDAKPDGAELNAEMRRKIAETVGIGAIKYADLSQSRTTDYEFSYDKMMAMNGNTATYMQFAYVRVRSIFRKGEVLVDMLRRNPAGLAFEMAAERSLAIALLRFEEALESSIADFRPNLLTAYLYDLSNHYSTFFEQCPVLKAPTEETRHSRLLLCDLTARTIKLGLELLNIQVVEQM